jgi:hypothetical protein
MSHTSVKQSSSSTQQPSLTGLLDFGLQLVLLSIENVQTIMQQAQTLLAPVPLFPGMRRSCGCEIPEQDCPPHCACEVEWNAVPGETLLLAIRVTNSWSGSLPFQMIPTPFTGISGSPGTIAVSPSSFSSLPGQSQFVNATFTVPQVPEGQYNAEIVVRGLYDQYVCVTLNVQCKKTCGDSCGCCEVIQGAPPQRIRAHQWYHHFQCTEDCVKPRSIDR